MFDKIQGEADVSGRGNSETVLLDKVNEKVQVRNENERQKTSLVPHREAAFPTT